MSDKKPNLMYAQMGIGIVEGVGGLLMSREQQKMDAAIQAYNNTMSALAAAQSFNSITQSENDVRDASVRMSESIQRQTLIAEGQAKVSAGAAGVEGGSVDQVMAGLRSSASQAQYARGVNAKNQRRAYGQERRNVHIAKALNKDVSVIPRPSAASAALGLGTNLLSIWDSHQTPDNTVASRLGRTGDD